MSYSRYAIYYVPTGGKLADFGSAWLGWDINTGQETRLHDVPGLHDVSMTPRKYGFHGTLKPPFRLKETTGFAQLEKAARKLAGSLSPAACDGLEVSALGHFLALTPSGNVDQLRHVAAACVRELDPFRAPASAAELTRRRNAGLNPRQEALLMEWGYPYVLDEFRFHLTLSGRLPEGEMADWAETLKRSLPDLPAPFVVDQIALCGEREDGHFEVIHHYALSG